MGAVVRRGNGAETAGAGLVVVEEEVVLSDGMVGVADVGTDAGGERSRVDCNAVGRRMLLGVEVLSFRCGVRETS